MAKIIAPNENYNGVSATVHFAKGKGETSDKKLIKWFKDHGYEVVEDGPSAADKAAAKEAAKAAKEAEKAKAAAEEQAKKDAENAAKAEAVAKEFTKAVSAKPAAK